MKFLHKNLSRSRTPYLVLIICLPPSPFGRAQIGENGIHWEEEKMTLIPSTDQTWRSRAAFAVPMQLLARIHRSAPCTSGQLAIADSRSHFGCGFPWLRVDLYRDGKI